MKKGSIFVIVLSLILVVVFWILIFSLATNSSIEQGSFHLLCSSENEDLEPLLKKIAKKHHFELDITYEGNIDMMRILNEEHSYDGVLSSNSIWLYMLENPNQIRDSKSLFINPVVFGVKKSKAKELGFIDKELYVKDILSAVELDQLKFIMPSPTRTNTGASAYFGFISTLAGNPEILTLDHLGDTSLKSKLEHLLLGVERTSGSDEFLSSLMEKENYEAFVSYESSFIEINGRLEKEGKEPYYLLYPVDGVTLADAPFGYIDRKDDGKKKIFQSLQKDLLSDEGKKELESLGRRTWYGGVTKQANLSLFQKDWGIDVTQYLMPVKYPSSKVMRRALELYQDEFHKPVHTVFCLDFSGSMIGSGKRSLVDAMEYILTYEQAKKDMLQFAAKDKITIIPFQTDVKSSFSENGNNSDRLLDQIKELKPSGNTNLYGALTTAVSLLEMEEKEYNVSIVVMTDGAGNIGKFSDFSKHYKHSSREIPIYGILFGDAKEKQLKEIADLANGKVFDGRTNLLEAFQEVRGYN